MGLSVAFDLPTQIVMTAIMSWLKAEVGKTGVAIDSIEDMQTLFKASGWKISLPSMTINATGISCWPLHGIANNRG